MSKRKPFIFSALTVCEKDEIAVGLQLASLKSRGLDASSGHLVNSHCSDSTERYGVVWYRVARQAKTCGNTLTVSICLLIHVSYLT